MTLFEQIIERKIPADIVYEDDLCIAFHDIAPQAPVHVLVVPKKPLPQLSAAEAEDQALLGHLLLVANQVAAEQKLDEQFRVVINNGELAGQTVFHLHVHVLGKRMFSWPPG